eukprot:1226267-Karenia_brevis.AAC.1
MFFAVRAALERAFPDILPGDYLEFHFHCSDVARLVLGHNLETAPATLTASSLHVVCIDMNHIGSGDVVGHGPLMIAVARRTGNDFVPLLEHINVAGSGGGQEANAD